MDCRICIAVLVLGLTACDNAVPPPLLGPQPTPAPPAAPPPAAPAVKTNLTLSNVSVAVVVREDTGKRTYSYVPSFSLTETTGVAAAIVVGVEVAVAGGPIERTDEKCWGRGVRIEPGATSEAFGPGWWNGLSYCTPEFTSTEPVPFVSIGVSFSDDAGTWSSVSTRVDIE